MYCDCILLVMRRPACALYSTSGSPQTTTSPCWRTRTHKSWSCPLRRLASNPPMSLRTLLEQMHSEALPSSFASKSCCSVAYDGPCNSFDLPDEKRMTKLQLHATADAEESSRASCRCSFSGSHSSP